MSHTYTYIFTYIYTHIQCIYIHITHQNNTRSIPKLSFFSPLKKGRFSLSFQRRFSGKNHLKPWAELRIGLGTRLILPLESCKDSECFCCVGSCCCCCCFASVFVLGGGRNPSCPPFSSYPPPGGSGARKLKSLIRIFQRSASLQHIGQPEDHTW